MSLSNFFEEFLLYRKITLGSGCLWERGNVFSAALTATRTGEVKAGGYAASSYGTSQKLDIDSRYSLYVPLDGSIPDYDDYIERLEDGQFFKVVNRPSDYRTPDFATYRCCILILESAESPISETDFCEGGV